MKKIIALLTVVVLLTAFAGCQIADSGKASAEQTEPVKEAYVPQLPLTKQTATELALSQAGVKNEDVKHLHVRRDTNDEVVHYDVDFRYGEYHYAYEFIEQTGEILKLKKEYEKAQQTQNPETQLSAEEAQAIALEHAGTESSSASELKVTFDQEDHLYQVEFTRDNYHYSFEVCAEFGTVLDMHKNRIN